MQELAETEPDQLPAKLQPITTAYEDWIVQQRAKIDKPGEHLENYRVEAERALAECERAKSRIDKGIALLGSSSEAAEAFRFANRAMWRQRVHSIYALAKQILLLVTFAAYRVPMIQEALSVANSRGIVITFIGEFTAENEQASFDPLHALGAEIAQHCAIYVWPHEKRQPSPTGHKGVLHAKCAIADDHTILISSANLTDAALASNMELGVVIRNGGVPPQAKRHFDHLIASGALKRWAPGEP
jgi:hypothetical protein